MERSEIAAWFEQARLPVVMLEESRISLLQDLYARCRDFIHLTEANLKQFAEQGIDAYVPDNGYRPRDPRYVGQDRHRSKPAPLYNKTPPPQPQTPGVFRVQDFHVAQDHSHCVCPAGARLHRNGHHRDLKGFTALKFTGRKTACGTCSVREHCLRYPDKTPVRQVAVFLGPTTGKPETYTARMKCKIDSPRERELLARRFATAEPVFGNLRHNKRLDRFTLRGRAKVDGHGSCTVWSTTLRSWRIWGMRAEGRTPD